MKYYQRKELYEKRAELRKQLKDVDKELEDLRRPEWLRTSFHGDFSQWAEHAEIEPLTDKADAAYEGWSAARDLYGRHLNPDEIENMRTADYRHEGYEGHLQLWYPDNDENPKDMIPETILKLSGWDLMPRNCHYPQKERVPRCLSMKGCFVPCAGAERFLVFQANYWNATPEQRSSLYFGDILVVGLQYGAQTLTKGLQFPRPPALFQDNLDRYKNGEYGVQFNIWFRDWYNPRDT